jgi:hypothetical protein
VGAIYCTHGRRRRSDPGEQTRHVHVSSKVGTEQGSAGGTIMRPFFVWAGQGHVQSAGIKNAVQILHIYFIWEGTTYGVRTLLVTHNIRRTSRTGMEIRRR